MLFLPMARSSAMMPYYNALDSGKLTWGNVKISAMDLGKDTVLLGSSSGFKLDKYVVEKIPKRFCSLYRSEKHFI